MNEIQELALSVQRALLGEITSNMAAITAGLRDRTVLLRAYCFGPVTDEDKEHLSLAATQVIADYPEPWTIEESCISLLESKLGFLDIFIFMRAEMSGPAEDLQKV